MFWFNPNGTFVSVEFRERKPSGISISGLIPKLSQENLDLKEDILFQP